MKKSFFAMAAVALVGCSSHDLVDNSVGFDGQNGKEIPIEFSVQKQNITRAAMETLNHYNFGVWAWKVQSQNSLADQEIMNNYLVGYSDNSSKGYDKTNATTWAAAAGSNTDHTSPGHIEQIVQEVGPGGYQMTARIGHGVADV